MKRRRTWAMCSPPTMRDHAVAFALGSSGECPLSLIGRRTCRFGLGSSLLRFLGHGMVPVRDHVVILQPDDPQRIDSQHDVLGLLAARRIAQGEPHLKAASILD